MHPLKELLNERKLNDVKGIVSICTANPRVLKACFDFYKDIKSPLVIEATANQVNQDGGYTGMIPETFKDFVYGLAEEAKFPLERLFLGGDHLGPLTWSNFNEAEALEKSKILVRDYVLAGFTKIHLDTSMRLADDSKNEMLSTDVIARRGITLLQVCEEAYQERLKTVPNALQPVYIIGSEVPIPGGAQEEEGIEVTKVDDFKNTVKVYREHMEAKGLLNVWDRVLAVVVQPGVEFGDASVHEYDRIKADKLIMSLKDVSGLVFEGHSTDYQTRFGLKEMVEDGIAILKVGPALTFALREGLYALAYIEKALIDEASQSKFMEVLEAVMLENPSNWKKHYHGSEAELVFKRHYSFSDRSRYYMPDARIEHAIEVMMKNLSDIPLSLLSQFMPIQYRKVREGQLKKDPEHLAQDVVHELLKDYRYAVEGVY